MINRRSVLDRPRRVDGTLLTPVEGGGVLTGIGRSRPVGLNPTAMAIWELCDGDTHVEEMVSAVCVLFAITPAQARDDVQRLLEELRTVGAIA